jgi:colanic acid/amylovoran biosynthesis glycosyltransferase
MTLRVAFVLSQFPALSETFVVNQVTGLIDRGADVEILSAHLVPQPRMHAEVESYDLIGRTRYGRDVPDDGLRRRLLAASLLARAAFRRLRSIDDLRWLIRYGRQDARTALPFAHLHELPRRNFDAIVCHFGPQGQWGMALRNVGLLSGRLVTIFHGYDMSRFLREEGVRVYDRLLREGDLFLPVTEYWRRRLIELGSPAERTVVHRMGVNVGSFNFVPRSPPRSGPVRLLSVARLTEKKGMEYGIRAVAELMRDGMEVRYDIVGAGPDEAALRELIRSLGLEHVVKLVGSLPGQEVLSAMAGAHVLLAPSVTARDGNQEGLPVVLMEALASGLPVVSTRHTGIPELVEHGVTGMLARERDVAGLVEGVRTLLRDPALYTAIAARGRARVARDHDIDQLNDQLADLLAGQLPYDGSRLSERRSEVASHSAG